MQRREKGTGTIYQRDNGTWVGRVSEGRGENGKQKYKCFSGKTEAEVKRKIREYNKAGPQADASQILFKNYLTNWLMNIKKGTIKDSSFDRLESTANTHVIPALGCYKLSEITPEDVSKMLNVVSPIVCGGVGQEFGLRGGTENVPGVVGFGQACMDLHENNRQDISNVVGRFLVEFLRGMKRVGLYDIVSLNAYNPEVCTKILSITLHGIDNDTLLLAMDRSGICIGTGSACRSHEVKPSHVLKAIGLSNEDAMSTIRISFSKYSTTSEVTDAARKLVSICEVLTSRIEERVEA